MKNRGPFGGNPRRRYGNSPPIPAGAPRLASSGKCTGIVAPDYKNFENIAGILAFDRSYDNGMLCAVSRRFMYRGLASMHYDRYATKADGSFSRNKKVIDGYTQQIV
jgi:hypothetical protein